MGESRAIRVESGGHRKMSNGGYGRSAFVVIGEEKRLLG
jgi:hypothetical protein